MTGSPPTLQDNELSVPSARRRRRWAHRSGHRATSRNDAPTTPRTALSGHATSEALRHHPASPGWLCAVAEATRSRHPPSRPSGDRGSTPKPFSGEQERRAHSRRRQDPVRIGATATSHKTRIALNPLQLHTHLQQVAGCLHVDTGGGDGSRPWHAGKARPAAPGRPRPGRAVPDGAGPGDAGEVVDLEALLRHRRDLHGPSHRGAHRS